MAKPIYTSYTYSHYQPYLDAQCVSRPSILDQFLKTRTLSSKQHIAIIVKRGKILAEASNKIASRSNGAATRGSQNYIHAERNVLRALGDINKLRGADMYIMRLSKCTGGGFMYSQPCPECTVLLEKCMREYGLKNVYFTA
jgi:tRNA(Arg) A34 adenosine deaminase TadA